MDDITKEYRFQRILHEAAQYRVLRRIIESDHSYDQDASSQMATDQSSPKREIA